MKMIVEGGVEVLLEALNFKAILMLYLGFVYKAVWWWL